jgi:GrpB-like predicted nucleotidyltransferase (UPF0157 family)
MTSTTAGYAPETREQIARLTRALAARERCATQATRCTVRATLTRHPGIREEYVDLAREYRVNRDAWDAVIRDLRRALRD